jgi:hypothetical protein
MFLKLLLTAAVIIGAILVIRARMRRESLPESASTGGQSPFWRLARTGAYVLAGAAVIATAVHLVGRWDASREVLEVEVVNANTGTILRYQARRGDIDGRAFRTLEGQVVRLADVERMILTRPGP